MSFYAVFGKNYIPAPEAKVENAHDYGMDGVQYTGTLVSGGGTGDATLAKQTEILEALVPIAINAKIAARNTQS